MHEGYTFNIKKMLIKYTFLIIYLYAYLVFDTKKLNLNKLKQELEAL